MGGTTIADLGSHLWTWRRGCSAPSTRCRRSRRRSCANAPSTGARDGRDRRRVLRAPALRARARRARLEVARVAPRRPCDFVVEVNGCKGPPCFPIASLNELWFGERRRRPSPLRTAPRPRRAPLAPRDEGLVAHRPGCRLRRELHQSGGGPGGGLAGKALEPRLRAGRGSRGGVRGHSAQCVRAALGDHRRRRGRVAHERSVAERPICST